MKDRGVGTPLQRLAWGVQIAVAGWLGYWCAGDFGERWWALVPLASVIAALILLRFGKAIYREWAIWRYWRTEPESQADLNLRLAMMGVEVETFNWSIRRSEDERELVFIPKRPLDELLDLETLGEKGAETVGLFSKMKGGG